MNKLSFESFIDDVSYGLQSGSGKQKYCFILGAGASVQSGIDSGEIMVEKWEKNLSKRSPDDHARWKAEKNINASNQGEHYSDYYERCLMYNPEWLKSELTKCIERGKPSVGYSALAYILIKGNSHVVLTTNFDHLTEIAISQAGNVFPRVVGHEALADYIDLNENRPTIIKLHRDIMFEPLNTNNQTKVLETNIKRRLPIIFKEYHPIFVGYAGNDKSLMDFLMEPTNLGKFSTGKWKKPYWTIYKEEPMTKQREFIEKSNGFLINKCSFDQIMIALGQRMGWTLPPKTVYLEKIQKKAEEDYDRHAQQVQDYIQIGKELLPKDLTKSDCPQPPAKSTGQIVSNSAVAITKNMSHDIKETKYRNAIHEYSVGQYRNACMLLEALAAVDANDPRIYNGLSSTYFALGNNGKALEYGKRAVSLAPDNPYYHEELAKVYFHVSDANNGNREIATANKLRNTQRTARGS